MKKRYRIKYDYCRYGRWAGVDGWCVQERKWWGWQNLFISSTKGNALVWMQEIAEFNYISEKGRYR